MDRSESKSQNFPGAEQMMQVGSVEALAGFAVALRLDWDEGFAVAPVEEIDASIGREHRTVAGKPCWKHAIEHVDPLGHPVPEIFWRADTHEIAWFLLRELWNDDVEHRSHLGFSLAHAQTADCNSRNIRGGDEFGAELAEFWIHATLANAEEYAFSLSIRSGKSGDTAFQPAMSSHRGVLDFRQFGRQSDQVIERHHDVGAELPLDVDSALWSEHVQRTVYMRPKADALLGDLGLLGQREDLKSTAIRQDRALPPHERVKATCVIDEIRTGTEHQVIGVRQDDLRAEPINLVRMQGLYRGLGPDRHEYWGLNPAIAGSDHSEPRTGLLVGGQQVE